MTQLLKVFFLNKPKQAGFSSPVKKPRTEKTKKSIEIHEGKHPAKHVGPAKPPTYQPLVDCIMGEICEKTHRKHRTVEVFGYYP